LHCHARHFLDTIAAGKDLYAEKTMTWSIAEAAACRAAAQGSSRVIQIGLQHVSTGVRRRAAVAGGRPGRQSHGRRVLDEPQHARGHGQWVRAVPSDCTADHVDWNAFLNGRG